EARPTPPTGWWSWSSTLRHDPRPLACRFARSLRAGIAGSQSFARWRAPPLLRSSVAAEPRAVRSSRILRSCRLRRRAARATAHCAAGYLRRGRSPLTFPPMCGIVGVVRRRATLAPAGLEQVNAALVRARDAVWAVGRDRLRTAREVASLAGGDPSVAAIEAFLSVQVALSAIDRLEVRGRDSAGLHLLVRHH